MTAPARHRFPHHIVWPALIVSGLLFARFGPDPGLACPTRVLLDVPCPTCGGTRAVRALAHLDITNAFGFNPLVATVALIGLGYAGFAPVWVRLGHPPPVLEPRGRTMAILKWLLPLALVANWLYLVSAGRV